MAGAESNPPAANDLSATSARGQILFLLITLIGLGIGLGASAGAQDAVANVVWTAVTLLGLGAALRWMWLALRERRPSVDIIAVLALVGSLIISEPLAGAVIAVMLATGQWLEARSEARAERELRLLVQRRPTHARRRDGDEFVVVTAAEVRPGDELVVPTGEIVPVDGRLLDPAVLDESALTGESLPVNRAAGELVRSGSVNAGPPARLTATATDADSSYSGIVNLVTRAQAASAPLVRTADRFALVFVPLTLVIAGLAWWLSGDGVRAVAVLVVATPCPLILAAPIALIAGMSQASRRGVIIKGGAALERLAGGKVLLIDKTGTITAGRPRLDRVVTETGVGSDELLRLAASLEQLSPHVLASAMVVAARGRDLNLARPLGVVERPGTGISGEIEGRNISLGSIRSFLSPLPGWVRRAQLHAGLDGALTVLMLTDSEPAALFVFDDPIRLDAARMLRDLREAGIRRTVLVTGDRTDVAELVGGMVGIDAVEAETDPADKARIVKEQAHFGSTVMVGDGVNDAPALATADVGVALAARGTSASSEAAQVVMMTDSLDALADTMLISQRAHRYALAAAATG
ncbi:MAG: heavy metal translocating P-type ATPase, partial [Candidatus Nanopelagicales bacterium]|nr:heavy metal translocating P-type ATPase [Candidatus Nanopelagicales bacterium]